MRRSEPCKGGQNILKVERFFPGYYVTVSQLQYMAGGRFVRRGLCVVAQVVAFLCNDLSNDADAIRDDDAISSILAAKLSDPQSAQRLIKPFPMCSFPHEDFPHKLDSTYKLKQSEMLVGYGLKSLQLGRQKFQPLHTTLQECVCIHTTCNKALYLQLKKKCLCASFGVIG